MFTQVAKLGAGIAFYGQSIGIGLADRYRTTASGDFECERIITNVDDTRAIFMSVSPAVVRLSGGRRFTIGGRVFDSDHQFAARFE
jgi:hypothetical protein